MYKRQLQTVNEVKKPLLVKISPDLDREAIAAIITLAKNFNLAGIIATNTTTSREGLRTDILEATGNHVKDETGGISGAPIKQRSTEVIRFIWQETKGEIPIIGVGGIFTAADAWDKITAGASLLQVYTGWVYQGPWMVKNILSGLLKRLEAQGVSNLSDVVGLEHNN